MPVGMCLMPDASEKFKQALISGKLNPERLANMTTEARTKLLTDIVGQGNAKFVNREFEQKLLLKNQELGMLNWAKKHSGFDARQRAEIQAKVRAEYARKQNRLFNPEENQTFLEQLVRESLNRKYRVEPTLEQSKHIITLQNEVDTTLTKANENGIFRNKTDQIAHGMAKVNLENYVNEAKLAAGKISFKEAPVAKIKDSIGATPGVAKSLLSALDDSLYGRQGIKTLLNIRTSDIWVKNFLKSFRDIGRQLKAGGDTKTILTGGDDRAFSLIKADVYSRANALNGKYKAGNYGLAVHSEEAYPSSVAEHIPLFGRLFKASEVAFNGGAMRLRADLADRFIKIAEKQGINTLDKTQAEGLGTLVGQMTGRGSLDNANHWTNSLLFSPKFLKANFNGLTLHLVDKKATAFTKKEAAKNMAGIVTSVGTLLAVAHALNPNSVETDPRSSNFGKIKVGTHWVDITGGSGALLVLAAKTFVPTKHNGEWGLWAKSKTGAYTKLNDAKFGQQTALDTVNSFWEGKLAPVAGVVRDVWSGRNYSGQKPTVANELKGATTPLPIQNYNQLKDSKNSDKLAAMIADGFGFSVATNTNSSTTYGKNWSNSTSKELTTLKQKLGPDKFSQANSDYNTKIDKYLLRPDIQEKLKELSDSDRQKLITHKQDQFKAEIFKQYNYKAPKATSNKSLFSKFK
jgi:hypothetical protein